MAGRKLDPATRGELGALFGAIAARSGKLQRALDRDAVSIPDVWEEFNQIESSYRAAENVVDDLEEG